MYQQPNQVLRIGRKDSSFFYFFSPWNDELWLTSSCLRTHMWSLQREISVRLEWHSSKTSSRILESLWFSQATRWWITLRQRNGIVHISKPIIPHPFLSGWQIRQDFGNVELIHTCENCIKQRESSVLQRFYNQEIQDSRQISHQLASSHGNRFFKTSSLLVEDMVLMIQNSRHPKSKFSCTFPTNSDIIIIKHYIIPRRRSTGWMYV